MSDEKSENVEEDTKKSKAYFPRSVYFIFGNEFCERFTYYGLQAILTLFLHEQLLYTENKSTTIFHVWKLFAYFTPIFGAILADSWFGRFRTILYVSIFYLLGNILVSIGSIPNDLKTMKWLSIIGLLVVACGTGGIKPCVAAFGGDQYPPDKVESRKYFFSYFYFMINLGSLTSTLITPLLRGRVHCEGERTCYPLAFGVPAFLMAMSIIIFLMGKPLYKTVTAEKNIILLFSGCIYYAIAQRFKGKRKDKKHWLDYAEDKYDEKLINDTKAVLQLWFLMLPLPLFWALYDQQGSRWTLQAMTLDGNYSISAGILILPDQMQILNPILILIFIPLFDSLIYPMLDKVNILTKPLQRITVGGLFAALSFLVAGFLSLAVEKELSPVKNLEFSQMLVMNNLPCSASTNLTNILSFDTVQIAVINTEKEAHELKFVDTNCTASDLEDKILNILQPIQLMPNRLEWRNLKISRNRRSQAKNDSRLMFPSSKIKRSSLTYEKENNYYLILFNDSDQTLMFQKIKYNNLNTDYFSTETKPSLIMPKTVFPMKKRGDYVYKIPVTMSLETTKPKGNSTVSILNQIPQYIIITIGEILFSITGLAFSYSQAPESMISVVQASWLLTVAIGNLIIIFVSEVETFQVQSTEFFVFSVLMAVDMILFGILAYFYKSRDVTESKSMSD